MKNCEECVAFRGFEPQGLINSVERKTQYVFAEAPRSIAPLDLFEGDWVLVVVVVCQKDIMNPVYDCVGGVLELVL